MALPASALTTLAKLKAQLRITDSSADALLEDAITGASQMVADFIGRRLHYQTITAEKATGRGTLELSLLVWPVTAVTLIEATNGTTTVPDYECTGEDAEAGIVRALTGNWQWSPGLVSEGISQNPIVGHDVANYLVSYSGGWVTPNQTMVGGATALPATIELATLMLATNLYASFGSDVAVASDGLMSYNVSYGNPETLYGESGLPKRVEAMLSPYRVVAQM